MHVDGSMGSNQAELIFGGVAAGASEKAVTFIHTADWQLGMRARHVAHAAEAVRSARLDTVRRILALARDEAVDFVLVAGDLFEDNSVGRDLVYQVLHLFEQAAPLPIYILPGNHDVLGPASVYERDTFRSSQGNVHVLRDREPVPVANGKAYLLPAPITQKRSERDPTAGMPATPPGAFRIGVAHGSLRIEGKHQPDDHPIALDAAQREQLDYLAIGHWHSWYQPNPRLLMPGTPEPTAFDETSGYVACVRLEPDSLPEIRRHDVASLRWVQHEITVDGDDSTLRETLQRWAEGVETPERTLLRIRVSGQAPPEIEAVLDDLAAWLAARFLYVDIDRRELRPEVSSGRLREIAATHPLLGGLLVDLGHLGLLADPGDVAARQVAAAVEDDSGEEGSGASAGRAGAAPLPGDTLRALLQEAEADSDVVREALRQLGRLSGEVWQ